MSFRHKSYQPVRTMDTPENPYRYEPNDTYSQRDHCNDPSGFYGVVRISRDPENPGTRERGLGRSLLIVFSVHVAAVTAIFLFHNWRHLMSDLLDLISKFADLRSPITGGGLVQMALLFSDGFSPSADLPGLASSTGICTASPVSARFTVRRATTLRQ